MCPQHSWVWETANGLHSACSNCNKQATQSPRNSGLNSDRDANSKPSITCAKGLYNRTFQTIVPRCSPAPSSFLLSFPRVLTMATNTSNRIHVPGAILQHNHDSFPIPKTVSSWRIYKDQRASFTRVTLAPGTASLSAHAQAFLFISCVCVHVFDMYTSTYWCKGMYECACACMCMHVEDSIRCCFSGTLLLLLFIFLLLETFLLAWNLPSRLG